MDVIPAQFAQEGIDGNSKCYDEAHMVPVHGLQSWNFANESDDGQLMQEEQEAGGHLVGRTKYGW